MLGCLAAINYLIEEIPREGQGTLALDVFLLAFRVMPVEKKREF